MNTLTWTHTRKKIPMSLVGTWAQIQIKIWMIRHVFPKHPMYINGDPV